jgi:hypothetical protein
MLRLVHPPQVHALQTIEAQSKANKMEAQMSHPRLVSRHKRLASCPLILEALCNTSKCRNVDETVMILIW